MDPKTDLYVTLAALVACAVIGFFGYKAHFKKRDTLKAPVIPWIWVMLSALATAFMLVVHLVNLMGFETGR